MSDHRDGFCQHCIIAGPSDSNRRWMQMLVTPPRQTTPGTPATDHMMVPTRLVRCEWPPNDGVLPGDARFDDLFASIREEGVRVPLHLHLDWRVMDGNHRLSAARLLGIEWLPVRIWTGTEWVPSAPPRRPSEASHE